MRTRLESGFETPTYTHTHTRHQRGVQDWSHPRIRQVFEGGYLDPGAVQLASDYDPILSSIRALNLGVREVHLLFGEM